MWRDTKQKSHVLDRTLTETASDQGLGDVIGLVRERSFTIRLAQQRQMPFRTQQTITHARTMLSGAVQATNKKHP